mmetsp:Transcript_155400/g.269369  ORF Transcript_155400/g.269369 Transcript_155400/m.269369 type:complete len:108 (-) Transcript_155400:20-343(-)
MEKSPTKKDGSPTLPTARESTKKDGSPLQEAKAVNEVEDKPEEKKKGWWRTGTGTAKKDEQTIKIEVAKKEEQPKRTWNQYSAKTKSLLLTSESEWISNNQPVSAWT